ncbi:uncharacterized protein FN964_006554 isoform 1-T1 [Alca torda]
MLSCFFYDVKIELIYTGILIAKNAAIIQGAKGNPSIRQPKRFSRAVLCVLRLESEPFLQRRMKFGMKCYRLLSAHGFRRGQQWQEVQPHFCWAGADLLALLCLAPSPVPQQLRPTVGPSCITAVPVTSGRDRPRRRLTLPWCPHLGCPCTAATGHQEHVCPTSAPGTAADGLYVSELSFPPSLHLGFLTTSAKSWHCSRTLYELYN